MNKDYQTFTSLPASLSAIRTFTKSQIVLILAALVTVIGGFIFSPLLTFQVLVAIISLLYFADTIFNLFLTLRSLNKKHELSVSEEEITSLIEQNLPTYTILCPLYKEAHVVPQFVTAIEKLDWPKEKLDVMLLLEEDDQETITTVSQMQLPSYIRIVVVPDGQPKTKPKACNYGLLFAKGEYLVIYDAEDMPDPLQLKKAYLGFLSAPANIACLQAKLNYYNSSQNLLTRFFTAEYSLWFDITLTGLQSLNSTIPLGGTSNHFKTQILRDLQGWDPFNVTEDADLGIRLFKKGYKTAIIDSTTLEEANSKVPNWIRQRSRWIKGYMQTYLVHMRSFPTFIKEQGLWHQLVFQLTVGGKLLFILLNPLMWIITLSYFVAYEFVGPTIEIIYTPPIAYFAVFSWIFGNFLFFYYYMLGCAKRNQWDMVKYIFLIPFYWVLMSISGAIAFYQLLFKPHYWEKTVHGLHLKTAPVVHAAEAVVRVPEIIPVPKPAFTPIPAYVPAIAQATYQKIKEVQIYSRQTTHTPSTAVQIAPQPQVTVSHKGKKMRMGQGMKNAIFFSMLVVDSMIAAFTLPFESASTYIIGSALIKVLVLSLIIIIQSNKQKLSFLYSSIRNTTPMVEAR